ncbi:hypothetical protein MNBD_GAMMA11-1184 [hydrothermal vent metagenome]|uniref:Uncharacterized protein n=1 Tax=hydrothermal vent metagenome TaxID=652676 RepID=A0A3B0XAX4_9ZZZZ
MLILKKYALIITSLILPACCSSTLANELNWLRKDKLLISLDMKEPAHRQHLLYDIQKQAITPLAKADKYRAYSLSYTGRNILWYDTTSLRFGPVEKPLSKQHNIPVRITPPEDLDDYEKKHLTFDLAAAWINDRYFLVSQAYRFTGRSACMLFDSYDKKWKNNINNTPFTCPEHSARLSMKNLQKNILLITESTEGALLHSLWSTTNNTPGFPLWNLAGGYMRIYTHSGNSDKLLIASPCILTSSTLYPGELCKDQGNDTEMLFSYDIRSQSITMIAENLPPYASINSYEPGTVAWLNNSKICISRSKKIFCKKISPYLIQ